MDVDVLAERILLDLTNTFKKDPLIDEFDVLPVHESVSNKCPVIHVEHKIALEDWCVKHVYVYAYSKFFTWRKKPYKIDPECLLSWASAILLINPEIETVWNTRKKFTCQRILLPENELKFSELVLSRKPKSSPVYSHRKFVLLELKKNNPSSCVLQQIVDHELFLCTRLANLYPNNYYAWTHRIWVVKELCLNCSKVIFEELKATEPWCSTHISDHSGFHYRQFLLSSRRISSNCNSACPLPHANPFSTEDSSCQPFRALLLQELAYLNSLQRAYPGHETLWYHRRYILQEFHTLLPYQNAAAAERVCGATVEDLVRCKRYKIEREGTDCLEWNCYLEELFLDESFKIMMGNAWEKTLIERHGKWLKAVLSWPILVAKS